MHSSLYSSLHKCVKHNTLIKRKKSTVAMSRKPLNWTKDEFVLNDITQLHHEIIENNTAYTESVKNKIYHIFLKSDCALQKKLKKYHKWNIALTGQAVSRCSDGVILRCLSGVYG